MLIDQTSGRAEQETDIAEERFVETAVVPILHISVKHIRIEKDTGAFGQAVGGSVGLADDTALCHKRHFQLRMPVKRDPAAEKVLDIFMFNTKRETAVQRHVQFPFFFIGKNHSFFHGVLLKSRALRNDEINNEKPGLVHGSIIKNEKKKARWIPAVRGVHKTGRMC